VANDARHLRRVLVVDDDPGVLRYIELLLREEGFVVQTATDGVDAVALTIAHPPDLIVLDIGMPRMDGREVARTLREHGLRLPVILMSAGYDAEREASEWALPAAWEALQRRPDDRDDQRHTGGPRG
jgi:CheY-like chemotaxis protein